MRLAQFFSYYFLWHYGPAFLDIWVVSRNILWFLFHFFSIELLLNTFFSPFQRLRETYEGGLNFESFFESIVVNVVMRIVGMFMRFIVIGIGVVLMALTLVAALLIFAAWAVFPLLVPAFFILGFSYL